MNPYDYKKDKRKGREALKHKHFICSISIPRFNDFVVLDNAFDYEIQNKIMRAIDEEILKDLNKYKKIENNEK